MGDPNQVHLDLFPLGLARKDNQTDAGTCVRHAIAKCISSYLYKQRHIDVEQFEITQQLVQQKNRICGIHPSDYNDMKLIVQDVDNLIEGYTPRSWWEVISLTCIQSIKNHCPR